MGFLTVNLDICIFNWELHCCKEWDMKARRQNKDRPEHQRIQLHEINKKHRRVKLLANPVTSSSAENGGGWISHSSRKALSISKRTCGSRWNWWIALQTDKPPWTTQRVRTCQGDQWVLMSVEMIEVRACNWTDVSTFFPNCCLLHSEQSVCSFRSDLICSFKTLEWGKTWVVCAFSESRLGVSGFGESWSEHLLDLLWHWLERESSY